MRVNFIIAGKYVGNIEKRYVVLSGFIQKA